MRSRYRGDQVVTSPDFHLDMNGSPHCSHRHGTSVGRQQRAFRLLTRLALVLVLPLALACKEKAPVIPAASRPAPDSFRVALETNRGTVVVEVHRAWAPHGVDRFHELVASNFFDENRFFRVIPEFIAQFGANNDRKVNEAWEARPIPDDSVREKNVRGTLTFAADGKNTRTHQLFFNLDDNKNLDGQGFAPIGKVVEGMTVVDSIYSAYGERPSYHLIATLGNSYLARMFPRLDYIRTARIVGAGAAR